MEVSNVSSVVSDFVAIGATEVQRHNTAHRLHHKRWAVFFIRGVTIIEYLGMALFRNCGKTTLHNGEGFDGQ